MFHVMFHLALTFYRRRFRFALPVVVFSAPYQVRRENVPWAKGAW